MRCSPDVFKILKEEEIDMETFLNMDKYDFMSMNIRKSDATVLERLKPMIHSKFTHHESY